MKSRSRSRCASGIHSVSYVIVMKHSIPADISNDNNLGEKCDDGTAAGLYTFDDNDPDDEAVTITAYAGPRKIQRRGRLRDGQSHSLPAVWQPTETQTARFCPAPLRNRRPGRRDNPRFPYNTSLASRPGYGKPTCHPRPPRTTMTPRRTAAIRTSRLMVYTQSRGMELQ